MRVAKSLYKVKDLVVVKGRARVTDSDEFREFVAEVEPRLRQALLPVCGSSRTHDAVQEALIYGWEHWERVRGMDNPAGYLFRVARSRVRWARHRRVKFAPAEMQRLPDVEPALPSALARLTERQRVAVFLIVGCEWTYEETGELMDVSVSTVRNHLRRGLDRLRTMLAVPSDA